MANSTTETHPPPSPATARPALASNLLRGPVHGRWQHSCRHRVSLRLWNAGTESVFDFVCGKRISANILRGKSRSAKT